MQLREALKTGLKTLVESGVPSPELAAELLLMHVLGRDRGYLYAYPEVEISEQITSRYLQSVDERATGKPTQYITGHQEFWGLDLEVTPDVLIPRPETEHVVEAVIDLAQRQGFNREAPLRMVDVGAGSGCIALALAAEFPRAILFATDISRPALDVASRNAARLGTAERVTFLESDLLACFLDAPASDPEGCGTTARNTVIPGPSPCHSERSEESRYSAQGRLALEGTFLSAFDFVVSNPPYVAADELDRVQREVRQFEPRIAWGGLERGDEVYRRLIPQARAVLKPGGWLIVEIGYNMGETVPALLGDGWTEVEVRPDLAGIPRVVLAQRAAIGARLPVAGSRSIAQ
ncbi:MAG: peptide chain release factor N(5)-glutamine methyltransferase [Acidobacteria bacterium]|nr:MAG: peptide chain release factor N(5)-glutamine methyltransferase [Acidobacteriota bacterium]